MLVLEKLSLHSMLVLLCFLAIESRRCVCLCACMHVHVHVCMVVCLSAYMYVHAHECGMLFSPFDPGCCMSFLAGDS